MQNTFKDRLAVLRAIWQHRWVRFALSIWALLSSYDLLLSEVVPEKWSDKAPRLRQFIAMTSGLLPLWAWLLMLAAILVAASLEFAFRRTSLNAVAHKVKQVDGDLPALDPKPHPIAVVPEATDHDRKKRWIRTGRALVARVMRQGQGDNEFKRTLEAREFYYDLRPHLSIDFTRNFYMGRTVFIQSDGTNMPVLMSLFLIELDRLEGEWGLR